jgi:hypothetical protein
MKSIKIKIKGGLGNQLYQYAMARSYSIINELQLILDVSFYGNQNLRPFLLSRYKINAHINYSGPGFFISIANKLQLKLKRRYIKITKTYAEKDLMYDKFLNTYDVSYFDGYFQSYQYFEDHKKIIKSELSLMNNVNINSLGFISNIRSVYSCIVAVHIRRGDYLSAENIKIYNNLDLEYYLTSMELISSRVSNPFFIIFSDDIHWCKKNWDFSYPHMFFEPVYIDGCGIIDHDVMRVCDHFIISNSTYSWWAAYLGEKANSLILSPQKWFHHNEYNLNEIIPDEWIHIDV